MMKKFLLSFLISLPFALQAQVGVATNQPTKMLDVNGNVRIQSIPIGSENDQLLTTSTIGEVASTMVENARVNEATNTTVKTGDLRVVNSKIDVTNDERFPTLDLWTEQELNGEESIKDVYLVALAHRITLPENRTTLGDNKVRKIVFILMDNNAPEGFDSDSYNQGFDDWFIYFQTKKYEMKSNGEDCYINDNTFIYKPQYSDLFVPNPAGYYLTEDNLDGNRSELKGRRQDQVRDREFVFYDFGGKWILSTRD